MRVQLLAVGRLRPAFREVADDYLRRLRHACQPDEREVREAPGEGDARRTREGEALLSALAPGLRLVALDRRGSPWSSSELAGRIAEWQVAGAGVALAIGGADGLDQAVVARAAERWSLGPLTLPHELARVVVLEQLYRGFSILAGHPYHRGD